MEKTIEQVRALFENDRFATENGAVIDSIGDRTAVCSLELGARYKNAVGALMGGVSFTLADFAFAVASNWQNPGTVSLNSSITFLGTAKGTRLSARAVCIKDGRSTCCYRVDITDDLGTQIASVLTTGFRKS
jgi:uncharacterized domain 1